MKSMNRLVFNNELTDPPLIRRLKFEFHNAHSVQVELQGCHNS